MGTEKAFESEVRDGRGCCAIDVDFAVGEDLCCCSERRLGRRSGCSAACHGANVVCVRRACVCAQGYDFVGGVLLLRRVGCTSLCSDRFRNTRVSFS